MLCMNKRPKVPHGEENNAENSNIELLMQVQTLGPGIELLLHCRCQSHIDLADLAAPTFIGVCGAVRISIRRGCLSQRMR